MVLLQSRDEADAVSVDIDAAKHSVEGDELHQCKPSLPPQQPDRLEQVIQFVSRVAGPTLFVAAIAVIAWFIL